MCRQTQAGRWRRRRQQRKQAGKPASQQQQLVERLYGVGACVLDGEMVCSYACVSLASAARYPARWHTVPPTYSRPGESLRRHVSCCSTSSVHVIITVISMSSLPPPSPMSDSINRRRPPVSRTSADHYWSRSRSGQRLRGLQVPSVPRMPSS